MNRRYWAEVDGQRIYRDSLDAIKRIARDTADKLGRVVRVGYEDRPPVKRRSMRRNPDPGSFLPVWVEQEKGRKMRLDYLKATKARRLAKGLRGRDRGGQVKAAERRAEKTGKFAVHISGATINGVKQPPMTLQRASRRAAEALGAGFEAAGYKVTIAPV